MAESYVERPEEQYELALGQYEKIFEELRDLAEESGIDIQMSQIKWKDLRNPTNDEIEEAIKDEYAKYPELLYEFRHSLREKLPYDSVRENLDYFGRLKNVLDALYDHMDHMGIGLARKNPNLKIALENANEELRIWSSRTKNRIRILETMLQG